MTSGPSPSLAPRAPTIPGADPHTRKPKINLPPGSCDCHAHVFGPQHRYPYMPNAAYIPPDALPTDYVRMLKLARSEHCWFKLIGPYRISRQPPLFADVTPYARALVAAVPERCVWGADWPHPNTEFMPNDGDLADMLPEWIPDEAQRKQVLVDNSARLYGFC